MADILVELSLGTALEALLGAVKEARERAHRYESVLAQLEHTIHRITPKLDQISLLSKDDDVIPQIKLQLIRGKEVVDKCSNSTGCWSFCKSNKYYKKLKELDESLCRLITIDLQVEMALEVVRIGAEMKDLSMRWDQMHGSQGSHGWIFIPIEGRTEGLSVLTGLKGLVMSMLSQIVQNLFVFFRKRWRLVLSMKKIKGSFIT